MTSPVPEPDGDALQAAIVDAWADAYSSGNLAASQQLPGASALADAWKNWKPGDADAASLLDDDGWQQLLKQAKIVVQSVNDTTQTRVADLLAQGVDQGHDVDTIAGTIRDYLDSPDRALQIATTETARAVTTATLDAYASAGVTEWDWILSPDACEECVAEQETNPHELSDEHPPKHPWCRCAAAPRDPGPLPSATAEDDSPAADDESD